MTVIHKFPLIIETEHRLLSGQNQNENVSHGSKVGVRMPAGARILWVGVQRNVETPGQTISVWARVDPDEKRKVTETFVLVWTGQRLEPFVPENSVFVGTAVSAELVWHVYHVVPYKK